MLFLKLIFFLSHAHAVQTLRIDNNTVMDFTPFKHKYELIIEENCAHCLNQINILKNCVADSDVVILMDNKTNKSEEELKKILKKKKVSYQTFLLNKNLKEAYGYKGITPTIWLNSKTASNSYSGVASCEFLKTIN